MSSSRDIFIIDGGKPLRGEVSLNRAKNSALYLLLASILTPDAVTLRDVPKLSDVLVMLEILEHLGTEVTWHGPDLTLKTTKIETCSAPYSLVSKMRASFVAMGALLGRCGEARISMPGGCAFGPRPVDRHLEAFRAMGIEIQEESGDFLAIRTAPVSGTVRFEQPTVGGTQNVVLAAALGEGTVVVENAALEPEVADLADLLNAMGANVSGAGTRTITVVGARRLHGTVFRPIPDRIEAGTYLLAAAATRGSVTIRGARPEHLDAVVAALRSAGVYVRCGEDVILLDATRPLQPVDVVASEYPGIPTDLQAPFGLSSPPFPGRVRCRIGSIPTASPTSRR